MLGGSIFRDMEEDPFFAAHSEQMRRMHNNMFNFDPFRGFGMGQNMLEGPQGRQRDQGGGSRQVQPHRGRNPADPFDSMFGFGSMFNNMNMMMQDMHRTFDTARNNPDSHSYVQSSFYSYSNTGNGAPRVYQASSSTRTAPGGIKETRKALRDSDKGVEKMSVGHHIRDRGHVVEKARHRDGNIDENQEFINLDEGEAREFDREWKEKTRTMEAARGLEYRRRGERADRRGLPAPERERPSYRDRERRHKE